MTVFAPLPSSAPLSPDAVAAPSLHPEVGALFMSVMAALFRGDQTPEQAVGSFLNRAPSALASQNASMGGGQSQATSPGALPTLTPQLTLQLYQAVQNLGLNVAYSGVSPQQQPQAQQLAAQVQQGILTSLWQSCGAGNYSTSFASGLSSP